MPEFYMPRHKHLIWRITNKAALFISSFGTFYFFIALAPSRDISQGLPMLRDAKPGLLGSSSPPPPTLSSPILDLCKWIHMYLLLYDHDCSSDLNWRLSTVNKSMFLHNCVPFSHSLCKRPNLTNCILHSVHTKATGETNLMGISF